MLIAAALLLAGCARPPVAADSGPDEFAVLPIKPLEIPADVSTLPEPTPGGANLTDPTPEADVARALGGHVSPPVAGADAALVSYAGRYGVPADSRARGSARHRRSANGRGFFLWRWLSSGRFTGQALDPYAETERLQALGVVTPAPPPAGR